MFTPRAAARALQAAHGTSRIRADVAWGRRLRPRARRRSSEPANHAGLLPIACEASRTAPRTARLRRRRGGPRAAGIAAVAMHAEAQMLPVADGGEVAELAGRSEQRHGGIPEPERSEAAKLLAEIEREPRATRYDSIDDRCRQQVLLADESFSLRRERFAERLQLLGRDRQPCGCTMAAEALEVVCAGGKRAVEVEGRDRAAGSLPEPLRACDQDHGPVVALDEPRRDDSDHAFVPVLAPHHVSALTAFRLRPVLDLRDRCPQDLVLDGLPVTVQLLEPVGEAARLLTVFGQEQLERGPGMPKPARGVDPGREAEGDGPCIDCCGIDARDLHQRPQSGLLRSCQPSQPSDRQRAVLAHERDDIRDRRQGNEVELAPQRVGVRAEQRLAELVDDPGATELGEGIPGGTRRDDRTVRELFPRAVMVGDDHVQPELARVVNLFHRGDAAIDREDQTAAFLGQTLERLPADAVALVEPARQMPFDLRSELAQYEDGEHGRADAVDVVVTVDADALACRNRSSYVLNRPLHVAEQVGVVQGQLAGQEGPRLLGVAVAAPDEHARRDLVEAELLGKSGGLPVRARTDRPDALRHARLRYEGCRTAPTCAPGSSSIQASSPAREFRRRHRS